MWLIFIHTIGLLLAILPLLVVRAIRPFVLIRFGNFQSERIGHFAANTDIYLCRRAAGLTGRPAIDVFYHSSPVCNVQLKKMWDRALVTHPFASRLDRLNQLIPGGAVHRIPWQESSDRDMDGVTHQSSPNISFTDEEQAAGEKALEQMGVTAGSQFVCFHARDAEYLHKLLPGRGNWETQDYRNSDIQNFAAMTDELAGLGYYCLRMGADVERPLESSNPMIIDYATRYRTDFLDIFLSANCAFFVGTSGGFNAVPKLFRRPTVYVDFIPLEYAHTWGPEDLIIPKKLRRNGGERFLSYREILESGLGRAINQEVYASMGVEVVDNSPEDILKVASEMHQRLNGKWQSGTDDDGLQDRYWSLFDDSDLRGPVLCRMGADFLRENRDLLTETHESKVSQ